MKPAIPSIRPALSVAFAAAALVTLAAGCSPAPSVPVDSTDAAAPVPPPPNPAPEVTDLAGIEADAGPGPFSLTSLNPDDAADDGARTPDVVFVPTPHDVVDEMLRVAAVGPDDVLYDLGSGDGRIPVTAAERWGTRGVGIDIDPQRIREANAAAEAAGVTDRVEFIEGDLFEADLSQATVITLYLLPGLNMRLRPALLELKPGTRVVSHNYHMEDWQPQEQIEVGDSTVYFWTVPEQRPDHLR